MAMLIAFYIRLGDLSELSQWLKPSFLLMTVSVSLLVFYFSGFYQNIVRYLGYDGLIENIKLITITTLIFTLSCLLTEHTIPRSVPFLYWLFAIILIGGSRLFIWRYYEGINRKFSRKIAIYGAGDAGRKLLYALRASNNLQAMFFIDDDKRYQGSKIGGLKVYSPDKFEALLQQKPVSQVLLAMPSVSLKTINAIVQRLEILPVEVKKVPDISEIVSGKERIDAVRPLALEDLLGRTSVGPKESLFAKCITSKIVMITGAGGSIGSELCRQVIKHSPSKIILFEQSEFALYQIEQEMNKLSLGKVPIVSLLGSVQNKHFMQNVLTMFRVQTVYHAAAYKHVPIVEENIVEGVKNNIFGTYYLALAAIATKVEHFVFISTDKAVRPTNIMGASKRLAELCLQSLSESRNSKIDTKFCMVRFGNVLGSSGSVVPLFKQQIENGGPVTVTDPMVTRYFMTIAEAAQLVLQAGTLCKGGDVFVLDMGKSIKIDDLARRMIHLAGKTVKEEDNDGVEIIYTGLRPGEKLFEELLIGNNVVKTEHPDIMRAQESSIHLNELESLISELESACKHFDVSALQQILVAAPLNYRPSQQTLDLHQRLA